MDIENEQTSARTFGELLSDPEVIHVSNQLTAVLSSGRLNVPQLLVLLTLQGMVNSDGVWTGNATILAKLASVPEYKVQRALNRLKRNGFIAYPNKRGYGATYPIHLVDLAASAVSRG